MIRKELILLLLWFKYITSLNSPWKFILRKWKGVEIGFQSKLFSSVIFLTVSTLPAPICRIFPNHAVQAKLVIEENSAKIKNFRALEKLPAEINEINLEARKAESARNYELAKRLYLEVIEVEPTYVFSYAGLSNIYANQGQFEASLLYLNKAISLLPSIDVLIPLLIEKGTIESNLHSFETALQDFNIAEKLFSNQYNQLAIRMSSKWENANYRSIQINKAVIYSRMNQWSQAYDLFDQILYNAAEREVSPWIIRYVLASLEITSKEITDSSYILSKPTTDFMVYCFTFHDLS